MKRKKC